MTKELKPIDVSKYEITETGQVLKVSKKKMTDIKDRAREYLAEHSVYSKVYRQSFIAVDMLTAMIEFAEQEAKDLEAQIEKMKSDVVSEKDKAEHLEDVITYIVLNDILEKWEIKENE